MKKVEGSGAKRKNPFFITEAFSIYHGDCLHFSKYEESMYNLYQDRPETTKKECWVKLLN